jgi:3-dehydroquinate synthase
VDASIGGKTAVNAHQGKNLVGAFHQPRLVYAAMGVLDTLDTAEYRSGLGEVVKHAVVGDADFFGWLERNALALAAREPEAIAWAVGRSCALKAGIVAEDEREAGRRAILNFGHTVGHALEAALGFTGIRHGEAVALGMLAEARYWAVRGGGEDVPARLASLLAPLGLPRTIPPVPDPRAFARRLARAAAMDKKSARGTLVLVMPLGIGTVRLERIPRDDLHDLFAFLSAPETS